MKFFRAVKTNVPAARFQPHPREVTTGRMTACLAKFFFLPQGLGRLVIHHECGNRWGKTSSPRRRPACKSGTAEQANWIGEQRRENAVTLRRALSFAIERMRFGEKPPANPRGAMRKLRASHLC